MKYFSVASPHIDYFYYYSLHNKIVSEKVSYYRGYYLKVGTTSFVLMVMTHSIVLRVEQFYGL